MRSEPIVEEENPTEANISETGKEKSLQNQIDTQKAENIYQQENNQTLQ